MGKMGKQLENGQASEPYRKVLESLLNNFFLEI